MISLDNLPEPRRSITVGARSSKKHSNEFVRDLRHFGLKISLPPLMKHERWNTDSPLAQNCLSRINTTQGIQACQTIVDTIWIEQQFPGDPQNPGRAAIYHQVMAQKKLTVITRDNQTYTELSLEGRTFPAKEAIISVTEQMLQETGPTSPLFQSVACLLYEWHEKAGYNVHPTVIKHVLNAAATNLDFHFDNRHILGQFWRTKQHLLLVLQEFRKYQPPELPSTDNGGSGVGKITFKVWSVVKDTIPLPAASWLHHKLKKFYASDSSGVHGRNRTPKIMAGIIPRLQKHIDDVVGKNNCGDYDIVVHKKGQRLLPPEKDVVYNVAIQFVLGATQVPGTPGARSQDPTYHAENIASVSMKGFKSTFGRTDFVHKVFRTKKKLLTMLDTGGGLKPLIMGIKAAIPAVNRLQPEERTYLKTRKLLLAAVERYKAEDPRKPKAKKGKRWRRRR
ncbi:hypothetical protein LTR64_000736 [Lithohypha guttulata]|uniref:uncharacterized protein n=1 Tax=Lithohypha guttulata TaxID=1690604 RepID=UPI002DE014B4|nr:hypothetical protein LTR51_005495 [Lithohypha guttulata]